MKETTNGRSQRRAPSLHRPGRCAPDGRWAGPRNRAGAGRGGHPDPRAGGHQLRLVFPSPSPRLFVHEGARQALERKLRVAFTGPVILSITDNRHSIITHRVQRGVLHARIHHMFLDAPAPVVDALVRYVTRGDRDASAVLGNHIDDNGFRLARRKRNAPLITKGKHHDLLELFTTLNERYFGGGIHAVITWGKRPTSPRASNAARSNWEATAPSTG